MEITEKERKLMIEIHDKGVEEILKNNEVRYQDYVTFPIGVYLGLNKEETMHLYNQFKSGGLKVYFVNQEGPWLLNRFGEITLQN